jgi:hypothetical protein
MAVPFVATPACSIDIYPFEGGSFTISGNNAMLLSLTVSKNIRATQGTFTMNLVAGGPFGPNARPGWFEILTPMSLVVISMARAGRAQVVMIGVVRSTSYSEAWIPNQGVQRIVVVQGADFGYFFSLQNYYTQSLLNASQGSALGVAGALTRR